LPWGNQGPVRVAVVYYNNLAYVFKGASRLSAGMSSLDPVFMSTVKTFRRLRDNEFPAAEPDRIRVIKATERTTMEQLAKSSPIKKYPLERLRLLNDLYPDKQPVAGQRLKVVE
jgi:predicted Zn-dependent protease